MGPHTRRVPFVVLVLLITTIARSQQPVTGAQRDAITQQYLNLPLNFEINRGQATDDAKFLARASGYGVMLERGGIAFVLPGEKQQETVRLDWIGAQTQDISGEDPLAGRINYMHGKDANKWITEVPTFERVRYRHVYPGVDTVFYGNRRHVEYDLVVAPGADVRRIAMRVIGAKQLSIAANGELEMATANGTLRQHLPVVYQQRADKREAVAARYVLRAGNQVTLALADYDKKRALVIDPTLTYSTFLGGTGDDFGYGIVTDSSGQAYVTGETRWGFPTKNPFQGNQPIEDAFVTKFSSTGQGLIYSTYLGGSDGEGGDAITIDRFGSAYIIGSTSSSDFPVTAGAFQTTYAGTGDAFVTKLSPSGSSLVFSTYLGGNWTENGLAIAIDPAHNVYVTGASVESSFPTVNPMPNSGGGWTFITKFHPDGKSVYFSYRFGGSGGIAGSTGTIARGIAVDANSHIYIAGSAGEGLPVTSGAYQGSLACHVPGESVGIPDAFVSKISADGQSLIYSTYIGGCDSDQANGIVVDSMGQAYIAGWSVSTNYPTTTGAYQRTKPPNTNTNSDYSGFVTKLNASGSALLYSTYLHGVGGSQINAIAVDGSGRAYVTGHIYNGTFPLVSPTQSTGNVFVTKLWATGGGLIFSTRMGGSNAKDTGNAIVLDPSLNVYVTGQTFSSNFRTTTGAFDRTLTGPSDAFVVKLKQ